jgi:hypothetical protein
MSPRVCGDMVDGCCRVCVPQIPLRAPSKSVDDNLALTKEACHEDPQKINRIKIVIFIVLEAEESVD